MHAKFDSPDLNQLWALTTNSPTEHFYAGDSVIIDDSVLFAALNVGDNVENQVRNSYVVKHSRVDGAIAYHKEYKHTLHDECKGDLKKYSKLALLALTLVRDSFANVFVGQSTCLTGRTGAYVLKLNSKTGEVFRAKLLAFASLEVISGRLMDIDSENN